MSDRHVINAFLVRERRQTAHCLGISPSVVGYLGKLVRRLSVMIKYLRGASGRTTAERAPDGQNDEDCNRDQLIRGSMNGEITTKF